MRIHSFAVLFITLGFFWSRAAVAAPEVGDTYVYRVTNAYSHEARGFVTHRVESVDSDRVTISVSADPLSLGARRTDVFSKDGNWLQHPLVNHDMPVEYTFSPAYPAYMAPLDTGKSWSVRVRATNPNSGRSNSVRVDGDVLGTERITTPAGSFDTIKIKRRVYAGDWETFTSETSIVETDWYAPALRRPVRIERTSGYMDPQRCVASSACTPVRGDWDIFELVKYGQK